MTFKEFFSHFFFLGESRFIKPLSLVLSKHIDKVPHQIADVSVNAYRDGPLHYGMGE